MRSYDPTAEDEPEDPFGAPAWDVPWHARLPGWLLAIAMSLAWLWHVPSGGMMAWGISGAALAQGRFETIALHMVAHGGLFHILLNASALIAISGPLIARMGSPPLSWLRYVGLFILSGLSGTALYLAIHPFGSVPMLGASGAIYGLLGLLLRLPAEGGQLDPIRSPKMRAAAIGLIKDNFWLFLMLTGPALLSGQPGGLAWEAHLGGFAAGLFLGPFFLPRAPSGHEAAGQRDVVIRAGEPA